MWSLPSISEEDAVLDKVKPTNLSTTGLTAARTGTEILKYPPFHEELYPEHSDTLYYIKDDSDVDLPVNSMYAMRPCSSHAGLIHRHNSLGEWSGILNYPEEFAMEYSGLRTFNLRFHTSNKKNRFVACPKLYFPWSCTRADVTGSYTTTPDGTVAYSFSIAFNVESLKSEHYRMSLSPDNSTITGVCGFEEDLSDPRVVTPVTMKKDIPPDVMVFYPTAEELSRNKARALWRFATSATLYQVQQRNFSWRFIKARLNRRRRLADLWLRYSRNVPLSNAEKAEYIDLTRLATSADLHFIWLTYIADQSPDEPEVVRIHKNRTPYHTVSQY